MRQITATEVTALNQVSTNQPALLALAVESIRRRTNDADTQADALALLGVQFAESIRTGEQTPTGEEADRIAQGAARRAVRLAAMRQAEDAARLTSLDALAESDPSAVETLAEHQPTTAPRWTKPETPQPEAITKATNAERIAAALSVVAPERRATLAAAVAAYETALDDYRDAGRLPTLAGALALAQGITGGRKRQTLAAQVADALADVEPYAARIAQEPNEATTYGHQAPTWVRPQEPTHRHLTEAQARRADALALAQRIAQREANEARQARPALATASRIVRRLPEGWGYPQEVAATYALPAVVQVVDHEGDTLAEYPAATWTPAHSRAVLEDLSDTTRPEPTRLAHGVTTQEANAGERAALFVPAAVRKSTSRKNKSGTTGPTVPAQPARTPVARTVEHPATSPAWQPVED